MSYTKDQVSQHCSCEDVWIICDEKVYDVTDYVKVHPGGDAILKQAGKDATVAIKNQVAHQSVPNFIKKLDAGKTALLKQLSKPINEETSQFSCFTRNNKTNPNNESKEDSIIPRTIPTIGSNILHIELFKKKNVSVCELGGQMAPVWPSYYKDHKKIMFVIDASSMSKVIEADVDLKEFLEHEETQDANIYGPDANKIHPGKIPLIAKYV
ncbi:Cytochrome B5-like protein [Nymphon striatum]|nr:Cytochrome B5-like protein [Nymphon striatum]